MGEELIFNRINALLADSGYKGKIGNMSDLRGFLKDSDNARYEAYKQVEELYDLLRVGPGMW